MLTSLRHGDAPEKSFEQYRQILLEDSRGLCAIGAMSTFLRGGDSVTQVVIDRVPEVTEAVDSFDAIGQEWLLSLVRGPNMQAKLASAGCSCALTQ